MELSVTSILINVYKPNILLSFSTMNLPLLIGSFNVVLMIKLSGSHCIKYIIEI